MTTTHGRIPPGPNDPFGASQELLGWMGDQFEQFGDIYKASIYGTSAYVIRNPGYAEYVLRENWRNYVKGQAIKRVALLLGNGLMTSEGESWIRQRRMIQPAFHREGMARLTKITATANAALLETWQRAARNQEEVNVTADVSRMVLKVVLVSIFGDDNDWVEPHFTVLSEETARSLEFAQTFRSLGQIVLQVADRRRKQRLVLPDILGVLMEARDAVTGQGMPDRQLRNEIMTLIVAGHETTASTLNWIWYLLSQHRDVEEKLSHELGNLIGNESCDFDELPNFPYTRQVIEEGLRLYPAGWLMTRRALKDDRLGDYFVPAGTEIYIPPYFIQRHPGLWPEPDRFDPDRFGPGQSCDRHRLAMLPFSAGPRNCIGELFARVEMQVHLMMTASRLRMRYVATKPLELDAGVNLRSKHPFIMTPEIKLPAER
jgi:cytochrome P450